ncbi:hypothetical protein M2459_001550 [Parabacteroides sp. PF5-5]|uniref:SusD/RagB family nutrient-binding outer membrane lipoprotein n=1 Tax=unclassified Parabacteroides TaxID=2649774 RepID=UPI0024743DA2|nr:MULTISPECIES: SusD/RagB family nutrient-binding outer membrane lipoprotein [unclassified Parabacteroides]MDH6304814.1 hypothetical protein [Parabacteroides sp. PH5-39]MDH6315572.1 hypothetical protein [Parabacteroides sp. PF5-13]MDH6319232.1 hypothetical protein [Parabacteroides sp. PH5-13]MDH6322963.1 hypothetical protein [Parabacteroides sp. PH5-8]MDH6326765.1 hypothetical protein [Parabacteroides sp. PH5-41]
MKTNRIIVILLSIIVLVGYSSCDTESLTNLDDPKYMLTPDNSDMSMMFSKLLVQHGRNSTGANAIMIDAAYAKYYSSMGLLRGALYRFDQGHNDEQWTNGYQHTLKLAITLEDYLLKLDNPLQANNIAFTRIMKVAVLQRLTDYYGDIPALEAGLAYINDILKPKYNTQEEVYDYMLRTLDEEAKALTDNSEVMAFTWTSNSDAKKSRDIVYGGDITKWRKYAYSMMLRLAMRISNVDPAKAKTYAEKAIAGGVILDNADNWTLKTLDGLNTEKNPYSAWFEGTPYGDPERYCKMGEFFVDFLKDNNDPRMKIIFGGRLKTDITDVTASDMQSYWRDESKWDWDFSQAKGIPHGLTANPFLSLQEYMHAFTSPNPFLFTMDQPLVTITASEMYFWLAEASLNGWTTGTTADAAYQNAIRMNMKQLNSYSGLLERQHIDDSDIDAYIKARPLGSGKAARERLAEEVWVSLYLNPSESWFNMRRMDLMWPDNIADLHMPVRHTYPENERANNLDNMNEALSRLGLGLNLTREEEWAVCVWWDVNDNF